MWGVDSSISSVMEFLKTVDQNNNIVRENLTSIILGLYFLGPSTGCIKVKWSKLNGSEG